VSKVGIVLGLALLAFGAYTLVTYFRPGGHGHAVTLLRAAAAVPLGAVAIYLSFSTACSGCGARLASRQISTSAARATALMMAAAASDGTGVARAFAAARTESGAVRVTAEACPRCRRLVRVNAGGGQPARVLAGDAAPAAAEAVLAGSESN